MSAYAQSTAKIAAMRIVKLALAGTLVPVCLIFSVNACGESNTGPADTPSALPTILADSQSVRAVYAIPSDRTTNALYSRGIQDALVQLQRWYADQLERVTFPVYDTIPLLCRMNEPGAYYTEDAWRRVLEELQDCAPVAHNSAAFGIGRWIGGGGHELGHALGLPHPPGCEARLLTCDRNALMWTGYAAWPNTYLREDEKAVLLAAQFMVPIR